MRLAGFSYRLISNNNNRLSENKYFCKLMEVRKELNTVLKKNSRERWGYTNKMTKRFYESFGHFFIKLLQTGCYIVGRKGNLVPVILCGAFFDDGAVFHH